MISERLQCDARTGGILLPAALTGLVGALVAYFALAGLPGRYSDWSGLAAWPGLALAMLTVVLALVGRTESRRLRSLAVLGACLLALVLASASREIRLRSDVVPIAMRLKQWQDAAVPIAYVGRYHAQFQFAGRLEEPLDVVDEDGLRGWITAHPAGVVVMVVAAKDTPAEVLFRQAYLDQHLVLLNAAQARAWAGAGAAPGRGAP